MTGILGQPPDFLGKHPFLGKAARGDRAGPARAQRAAEYARPATFYGGGHRGHTTTRRLPGRLPLRDDPTAAP